MRILVSRLSALGDAVCSLPVATAFKNAFPECHVTWMVDPRFAAIVEACTSVDRVVPYKFKFGERVRFDDNYDVALDVQGLLKSAWPIMWAPAKRKLGYQWQREGSRFVTGKVLPDPSSLHIVDQYVDVARTAGGVMDRAEFNLVAKPAAVLSCREKLEKKGLTRPFVALNPSAGWATKRWAPESFARLVERIQELGLGAVLIGGSGETDKRTAETVINASQAPITDMTGDTNVAELIALVSMSSAHVGGDTGSSHLAAALERPAIGLYSITNPIRSCPYGQRDRCLYDKRGLQSIPVEDVFEVLSKAVSETQ